MRKLVLVMAAVMASVGFLGGGPKSAAPATAATAPAPHSASSWAPTWMVDHDGDYTVDEAVAIASKYDVVAAQPWTFAPFVAEMRAANPNLELLAYVNGPFAVTGAVYPESWYAHNAAGTRVRSVRFGNDLMNVNRLSWRQEVTSMCDEAVAGSGYDGCFVDSMGNGMLTSGFLDSDPIDPRTLQVWDPDQWILDTAALMAYLNTNRPALTIALNGLGGGSRYFDQGGSILAGVSDLAMAESWLRDPTAPVDKWPTVARWRQNLDMLADAAARGTGVITVTKLWVPTTSAQRSQWFNFTAGSFLLGTTDDAHMFFLKDGCAPPCTVATSPFGSQLTSTASLGAPTESYRAQGLAYVRDFSSGFVAVNPDVAPVTVSLPPGNFRSLTGRIVSGTVVLQPHTAVMLTDAPAVIAACFGKSVTIIGTEHDDALTGTAGADVFSGLGGNDTIYGVDGADSICGGTGSDVLYGGAQNDSVRGGDGADRIVAASGNDTMYGDAGSDTCDGGSGSADRATACERRTAVEIVG